MAERRMFAKSVIDSDDFLDMPADAQLLYFHLSMRADDDGFITPKKIMRMIGASEDSLKILVLKKFVIPFDSGVIVIRHWKVNNYLRNDRYNETQYKDEKGHLTLIGNKYEVMELEDRDTSGIPTVSQRYPQDRIGKDRIGKDRLIEESNSLHSLSSSCFEPSQDSQPDDAVFIKIHTNRSGEMFPVTESYVSQMQELYPAVDVKEEIREAAAWCFNNDKRRKTMSGMKRFLNSWLARAQNSAKSCGTSSRPTGEDWMKQIENDPRYKGDGDITQFI